MPDGPGTDLMVGVEHGDDGAVVRVSPAMAVVVTADFFTPVVDDAYTFGRIAATNALSDIYAMGGEPLVAVNLLGWPRDKLPAELAADVLRGGLDVGRAAQCHVAGGHSIDDPEPKYGMAVTGIADPAALLRIDAGQPGLPLSLTKPIGTGVLNAWHKATGQVSAAAVEVMTTLNGDASRGALAAGIRCATDVTGFGLLGHLFKLARASGVSAVVDRAAVPLIDGTRAAARAGHIPGGSRRNLHWVLPHTDPGAVGCGRPAPARGRANLGRTARGRGAARSAGDRGAGPAPRQRAHHPVALQPRTSAAPGALPLREADERFRWTLYELMIRC